MAAYRLRSVFVLVAVTVVAVYPGNPAHAEDCGFESQAGANYFGNFGVCSTPSQETNSSDEGTESVNDPQFEEYRDDPLCDLDPASQTGIDESCVAAVQCDPGEMPFARYGLSNGVWNNLGMWCKATASPTITPGAVATALQRIPLPELRSTSQPATKTLVNFDTIFYVAAETLDRNIRLLGQDVDLTITPTRFRWTFGDGTDQVTTTPGDAYPAKTLTHRYQHAHVTVNHQVEVTWTATWRVNNGPWQEVPGSVTIAGPRTPLRIVEAVPLLSGADR